MSEIPTTKEVAVPSTQLLCEHVMSQRGQDRGEQRRVRIDADWIGYNDEGQEVNFRLIQQRGIGSRALYTLRTHSVTSQWQDTYRYDVSDNTVQQSIKSNNATYQAQLDIPPQTINQHLQSGLGGNL